MNPKNVPRLEFCIRHAFVEMVHWSPGYLIAFRSIEKRFILAHPFTIPSKCLHGFRATQLLSPAFTTTAMLALYITSYVKEKPIAKYSPSY